MNPLRTLPVTLLPALALCVAATPAALDGASTPSGRLGDLGAVGTVELRSSCGAAAQAGIERATALLHSFFYEEARRVYGEVAAQEPGCALAHWGVAMTWWHPIWTPPSDEERAAGRAALVRARAIAGGSDVERGLIAALGAYYDDPAAAGGETPGASAVGQSCHGLTGGADHRTRALAYERAMEQIAARYPTDREAAVFYALALNITLVPTTRPTPTQLKAAGILEKAFAEQPDHPGVAHYLIHGYDFPPIAAKGLPAAKRYAGIAPAAPHALHMPSHIFTRVGSWQESIDTNRASAKAAAEVRWPRAGQSGPRSYEGLHASTT